LTYPFVKERFEDGKLNIYGWYYVIDTGDIYNYDMEDTLGEKLAVFIKFKNEILRPYGLRMTEKC